MISYSRRGKVNFMHKHLLWKVLVGDWVYQHILLLWTEQFSIQYSQTAKGFSDLGYCANIWFAQMCVALEVEALWWWTTTFLCICIYINRFEETQCPCPGPERVPPIPGSLPSAPSPSENSLSTLLPTVLRKCLLFGLMTGFADLTVIAEPKGEEGTGFSWKKWAQRWNWEEQRGFQSQKYSPTVLSWNNQGNGHNNHV